MMTFLFVAAILLVNGENVHDYATLDVTLPKVLRSHTSAIYGDDLYIFSGVTTDQYHHFFNKQFYQISLSDKFTINAEKNNITSTLTCDDWEVLNVSPPTYEPNTNNELGCDSQCSALIDNYLYIVGAYNRSWGEGNAIYRLDLSKDEPEFASQSDFPSTIGFTIPSCGSCAASINNKLYIVGGVTEPSFENPELISYDPATNKLSN